MVNLKVQAAGIAALAAIGITLLAATPADEIGGALTGAAVTAAAALRQLHRLHSRRQQYEAAHATLGSQRERLRVNAEGHLAEQLAALNAQHEQHLLAARLEAFESGAQHALQGNYPAPQPEPAEAGNVLQFFPRRAEAPAPSSRN